MKVWQRPEQPGAQPRKSTPLEEKERSRWLEGYQCACEVKQACPAPVVVKMAARAGDIQEWFVDARRREPDQRAACSIRAKCHQCIVPGAAQRSLWAEMQQTPSWGPLTSALARQPEAAAPTGHSLANGQASDLPWGSSAGRQTAARDGQRGLCPGAQPTPGRGSDCVVTADESPGDGLSTGVPRGAVVSRSVGKGTLCPGAHARGSD